MKIDLQDKNCELKTIPILKSKAYSLLDGEEIITYKALRTKETLYQKFVLSKNNFKSLLDKFQDSFKTGA